ncbi:MAG: hypothetical protein H6Q25_700 [Bacteroidetes bacterium]|nr:hypothetical protein [Bacteroidota bacterium]
MKRSAKILIFLFWIPFSLLSQTNEGYPELKKYSNFGFTFGGVLFDKAKIEFEEGSYPISSFAVPSYSFGFNYHLPIFGKWSIQTGLLFANEAALNIKYKFLDEDIQFLEYNEEVKSISYALITPSIPLSVQYKSKIGNKSYLDLKLGMKMMLLLPSGAGLTNLMSTDTGYCPNFRIEVISPVDYFIVSSLITSIGYTIDLNKVLIGFELSRTINFQNTFSGRFRFYNLLINPDAYGYYNLSGNYWALNININFLKTKYWKKGKNVILN